MRRAILGYLALAAAAVAFFWLLVPVQREPLGRRFLVRWYGVDQEYDRAFLTWRAQRDTLGALETIVSLEEFRRRAALLGAPRSADLVVSADPAVPAEDRAIIERIGRAELEALGVARPAAPVQVIVSRGDARTTFFPPYRRTVVLPDAAGKPCAVVVQLLGPPRRANIPGSDRLLGTCGFYARFGEPGSGMRRWLSETGLRRAAFLLYPEGVSTSRVESAAEVNALVSVPYIGPCRAGILAACDSLFAGSRGEQLANVEFRDPVRLGDRTSDVLMTNQNSFRGVSAPMTFGLLGGLAAAMGPERFGEIWTSTDAPSAAYERAVGTTLGEGVRRYVEAGMSDYVSGPSVTWPQWISAIVVIALAAGLALRVPKRVMS